MKLSEYAKSKGIHYKTAHKHFQLGLIPGAYQLDTGTIIVPEASVEDTLLSDLVKLVEKHKKGKEC